MSVIRLRILSIVVMAFLLFMGVNANENIDDFENQYYVVSLDNFPQNGETRIYAMLTFLEGEHFDNDDVTGKQIDKYVFFKIRPKWLKEHEEDKLQIFILPSTAQNETIDFAICAKSQELTAEEILNNRQTISDFSSKNLNQQKTLHLQCLVYPLIKRQKVRILDANGDPITAKNSVDVECRLISPISQAIPRFYKKSFIPWLNTIDANGDNPAEITVPLFPEFEYRIRSKYVYYRTFYESPYISSDKLQKMPIWEPRLDARLLLVRLCDNSRKPFPRLYDKSTLMIKEDIRHGRYFLIVTDNPSDNPLNPKWRRYPLYNGFYCFNLDKSEMDLREKKQLCFQVILERQNPESGKEECIFPFKIHNPIHKLSQDKKMHYVDLAVTPIAGEEAIVPENRLAIVDKNGKTSIKEVSVWLTNAPHLRIDCAQPLSLATGKHRLLFHAPGYRLLEREITILEKGRNTILVEMEPVQPPLKITFDGPADTPAEQIILQYRYDAYPFLGVLQARSPKPDKGRPSLGLSLTGGKGEALVDIDAAQAFTLCASALPSPKFVVNKDSVSMPLPLMLYRHDAKTPAPARIALSVPKHVEWRGKIDMNALGAKKVLVIWARKVEGMSDMPLAAGTHSQNGACAALLEPGASYERYVLVEGKNDGEPSDYRSLYRSLTPYTVPADAKELPEETLIPGPPGSGRAVNAKIGGWMF